MCVLKEKKKIYWYKFVNSQSTRYQNCTLYSLLQNSVVFLSSSIQHFVALVDNLQLQID